MPEYHPLTDVIPTPATGVAVTSAWGDQVDDNLVHHYEGTWFRAIGGATTLTAAAYTVIPMTSIVISDTATDEATISIVGGSVQTLKPGIWLLTACVDYGASVFSTLAIDATDATAAYACEGVWDSTSTIHARSVSTIVDVTSTTNLFGIATYINSGTPSIVVNNYSPRLCGVWMCEHP